MFKINEFNFELINLLILSKLIHKLAADLELKEYLKYFLEPVKQIIETSVLYYKISKKSRLKLIF